MITKTRLIYALAVALPGLASVWLSTGFTAAPSPGGLLVAALGAIATIVLVRIWLDEIATPAIARVSHKTGIHAAGAATRPRRFRNGR